MLQCQQLSIRCMVILFIITALSLCWIDKSNTSMINNSRSMLPIEPKISENRKGLREQQNLHFGDNNNDNQQGTNFDDPMESGIISQQDISFFRNIQNEIDNVYDPYERCRRYNYTFNPRNNQQRRIFYGSLVAEETLELFNIVAAETYQIYEGMVLVESNRTQSFLPRAWKHYPSTANKYHSNSKTHTTPRQHMISSLFGISDSKILIKPFINEDRRLRNLDREHKQRDLIIEGWKQLGMQPNDIGLLADIDETFTRDYLRALQTCDNIEQLDYNVHHCQHEHVKIVATTRIYQSSPECITRDRKWFHPDIIIGHCIDGIGNTKLNPQAPRADSGLSYMRDDGYGKDCHDWKREDKITNNKYPLWNAADFRRTCGGSQVHVLPRTTTETIFHNSNTTIKSSGIVGKSVPPSTTATLGLHTGYHFHNFFANLNATRFKYLSYGHPDQYAYTKPIQNLSDALEMTYNCVMHDSNRYKNIHRQQAKWKHMVGGHNGTKFFVPIYFQDANYRSRRHLHVYNMIQADEKQMSLNNYLNQET